MAPTKSKSSPAKKNTRKWLWLFLLILAILIIIITGCITYYQLNKSNLAAQTFTKSITAINKTINTDQTELDQLRHKQENNFTMIQAKQLEIQGRLKKIQEYIPVPDPVLSASYAALATLDQLFETIHPINLDPKTLNTDQATNSTFGQKVWHGVKNIWGQLVTVRHASSTGQLLSPAATQLIILRLHSEISAAQWALLHQSPAIYQTAIANIHRELTQYFPPEETKHVLTQLNSLPEFPFENQTTNTQGS